jgi:hypothetical protein
MNAERFAEQIAFVYRYDPQLVLQRRPVIVGSAVVVAAPGGGLVGAPPVSPALVVLLGLGDAGLQVELAAGFGGGEG